MQNYLCFLIATSDGCNLSNTYFLNGFVYLLFYLCFCFCFFVVIVFKQTPIVWSFYIVLIQRLSEAKRQCIQSMAQVKDAITEQSCYTTSALWWVSFAWLLNTNPAALSLLSSDHRGENEMKQNS